MNVENVVRVLDWLKEKDAHKESGSIAIPTNIYSDVLLIVGENKVFKEELKLKRIDKNLLYQRILINKEFAFTLPELYWWEQYQLVQDRVFYFESIKHRPLDPTLPDNEQYTEKKDAEAKLEYLAKLSDHLKEQMKGSSFWLNHLTYLLG